MRPCFVIVSVCFYFFDECMRKCIIKSTNLKKKIRLGTGWSLENPSDRSKGRLKVLCYLVYTCKKFGWHTNSKLRNISSNKHYKGINEFYPNILLSPFNPSHENPTKMIRNIFMLLDSSLLNLILYLFRRPGVEKKLNFDS